MEKINSKCLLFQDDKENFKGPDGTLLCFKTDLFKELSRDRGELPADGRQEKQVSYGAYYSAAHLFRRKQMKCTNAISWIAHCRNFGIGESYHLSIEES